MNFNMNMPVRLLFGGGKVSEFGASVKSVGSKVFIVSMEDIVELGLLDKALASLKAEGVAYEIFSEVQPDPKSKDVDAVVDQLRQSGCDVVAGIGGGSAIDFAKALAICAGHELDVWSYVNLSNRPPAPVDAAKVLPVIAVPTTAGTGSEMTPYSVITNSETVQKGTIKEPSIFPKVSLVDPELMATLPPKLTAITGVDALAHSVESYFNVPNRTPYSDMIVEESVRYIAKYLPRAFKDGSDMEARAGMAWGSTLGGIAISQAGTTVVHALAQPLGARMGLSHGVSVSIFLLEVLKATLPEDASRFARLAAPLGVTQLKGDDMTLANLAIERMGSLMNEVEMPPRLSDFGAKEELIEELAEDVATYMSRPLKQHPRVFTKDELREIVRGCF